MIAPQKIKGGSSAIVKLRITEGSRRLLDHGRKSGSVTSWIKARSNGGHRLVARSIRIGLTK